MAPPTPRPLREIADRELQFSADGKVMCSMTAAGSDKVACPVPAVWTAVDAQHGVLYLCQAHYEGGPKDGRALSRLYRKWEGWGV